MARTRRNHRRERRAEAEASLKLVRLLWRDGRPSAEDVMWARSVSDLVAAAPVLVAMKHLREWEDFVLGSYSEDGANRVRREAESRGHVVELLTMSDYTPAYVASALGCSPLMEEELRVTFLPSFHVEGIITARRAPEVWEVEARLSRESLWYTRFTATEFANWSGVRRSPGVDVVVKEVSRDEAADAERMLSTTLHALLEPQIGVDGMTVHVCSRLTGASFEDERWCPERGSRVRAAADLALLLARNSSTDWLRGVEAYLS